MSRRWIFRIEMVIILAAASLSTPVPRLIYANNLSNEFADLYRMVVRCPVVNCESIQAWINDLEGYENEYLTWLAKATSAVAIWEAVKAAIDRILAIVNGLKERVGSVKDIIEVIQAALRGLGIRENSWIMRLVNWLAAKIGALANWIERNILRIVTRLASLLARFAAHISTAIIAAYLGFIAGLTAGLGLVTAALAAARVLLEDCKQLADDQLAQCSDDFDYSSIDDDEEVTFVADPVLPYAWTRATIAYDRLAGLIADLARALRLPDFYSEIQSLFNELKSKLGYLIDLISDVNAAIETVNSALRWLNLPELPTLPSTPGGGDLGGLPQPGPLQP